MQRTKTPHEDVTKTNQQMNAPGDPRRRRKGEFDTASQPASGAAVQHARVGAELSGEGRAYDQSETAEAIKRAAENDGRV